MECRALVGMSEKIALYIDHMLDDEEKTAVEDHLKACEACRNLMADLIENKNCLGSLKQVQIPEEFELRLKRALNAEKTKTGFRFVKWKSYGAVAAMLMIGLISFNMLNSSIPKPAAAGGDNAMVKSAAIAAPQNETAAVADNGALSMQADSADASGENLSLYEDLIKSKLIDYSYEILAISMEKQEFQILIKSDNQGKVLNKDYFVQFGKGEISSDDNWLEIKY